MGGAVSEQRREAQPGWEKVVDLKEVPSMSYKYLSDQFERFRALNYPEYILVFGTTLLLDHSKALGESRWDVMESVAISTFSFQVGQEDGDGGKISRWQKYCMDELGKKHGKTFRYKRLVGMSLESRGEIEKALEVYKQLLKFDPEDLEVRRRVISVMFEKNPSLIEDHLKECIMDVMAWKMKAYHLLTHQVDYKSALFCMEEVLLHEPQNIETVNIIAEIHLALGDYSRSRQYFCLAINIQKSNLRALWGILLCSLLKTESSRPKKNTKSESSVISDYDLKLTQLVVKQIINLYSEQNPNPDSLIKHKKDLDVKDAANIDTGINKGTENITVSMVVGELIDYYTNRIRGL